MDIFIFSLSYCFYTPFTKVEESFNVQAMHDILYHGTKIEKYDHLEFPGVVPRTFIGPLVVSITISPVVAFFEYLGINKFWSQYLVRLTLAAFVVAAFQSLRRTISQKFGFPVTLWYTLVTMSQFHFIFYMSRPLPNIFAMPLVIMAINSWLRRENLKFIWFSAAAIIVFRAELALLLGLFLIFDLYYKRIQLTELLKYAIPAAIVLIALTVTIDSIFWQRPLWPEAEVFWFNTILNKSSDWGTSPFLWYIYSAIPRAMGASLLFVPIGLYLESRIRSLVVPAFVFIILFSFLPHKELRFIIYTFPMLNVAVACACHRIWINRVKSIFHTFLAFVAGGHLIVNVLFTMFLLIVSGTNYPGGVAISRLHRLAEGEQNITIHIGNLAAQSGVSRFTEINANWTYLKTENLHPGDIELHQNDYLLVESKSKHSNEMKILHQTHDVMEFVDCFHNIGLQYKSLIPVRINTRPCIFILKKRHGADLSNLFTAEILDKAESSFAEAAVTDSYKSVELILETDAPADLFVEPPSEEKTYAELLEVEEPNSRGNEESAETDDPNEDNFDELLPTTTASYASEELEVVAPPLESPVLKRAYKSPKAKIKEIKYSQDTEASEEEKETMTTFSSSGMNRPKRNIQKIIKTEKMKQMIDDISKLDLNEFCDLNKMSTKDCLKQIIDDSDAIFET